MTLSYSRRSMPIMGQGSPADADGHALCECLTSVTFVTFGPAR